MADRKMIYFTAYAFTPPVMTTYGSNADYNEDLSIEEYIKIFEEKTRIANNCNKAVIVDLQVSVHKPDGSYELTPTNTTKTERIYLNTDHLKK